MSSSDSSPDWIVSRSSPRAGPEPLPANSELINAAKRLWPRVLAHARKELPMWHPEERQTLATEVWEDVLVSINKSLRRHHHSASPIADLDAYLFGAFLHRFNRALKRERKRQETVELVASSRELEQLAEARHANPACEQERSLEVKEVLEKMDDWTRQVFAARLYGYSWREIAEHHGLSVTTAKLRFRNAIRKLARSLRHGL